MQFYVVSRKETSKNKRHKEVCGIIEQTEGTAGIYPEGDKMKVKQLGTLQIFKVLSSWVMSE